MFNSHKELVKSLLPVLEQRGIGAFLVNFYLSGIKNDIKSGFLALDMEEMLTKLDLVVDVSVKVRLLTTEEYNDLGINEDLLLYKPGVAWWIDGNPEYGVAIIHQDNDSLDFYEENLAGWAWGTTRVRPVIDFTGEDFKVGDAFLYKDKIFIVYKEGSAIMLGDVAQADSQEEAERLMVIENW